MHKQSAQLIHVSCGSSLFDRSLVVAVLEARGIVDPSWTYVIADLEYYPGDTKPLDSSAGIDALQAEVSGAIRGELSAI